MDEDDFENLMQEAIDAGSKGDLQRALPLFRRLAEQDSENSAAWTNLGVTEMRAGHTEAAQEAYDRAMDLAPWDVTPRFNYEDLVDRMSRMWEVEELVEEGAFEKHIITPETLAEIKPGPLLQAMPHKEWGQLPRIPLSELYLPHNVKFATGQHACIVTNTSLDLPNPLFTTSEMASRLGEANLKLVRRARTARAREMGADVGGGDALGAFVTDSSYFPESANNASHQGDRAMAFGAGTRALLAAMRRDIDHPAYLFWCPEDDMWEAIMAKMGLSETLPTLLRSDRQWLHSLSTAHRAEFQALTRWNLAITGPPGAGMFLHQDGIHAGSWQLQLAGTKSWIVCPPSDSPFLYDGSRFDAFRPDMDRFPLLKKASCMRGTVHPGELLIYGKLWWHGSWNDFPSFNERHTPPPLSWKQRRIAEHVAPENWDGLTLVVSGSTISNANAARLITVFEDACRGGSLKKELKRTPSVSFCKRAVPILQHWWREGYSGTYRKGVSTDTLPATKKEE